MFRHRSTRGDSNRRKALGADDEGYDGVILIGPFNCLPHRVSEAILKPLSLQRGMPMLSYESDGYAVSALGPQAG